jgi:SNF2 family DNA or RNA helicase
MTAIAAEPAFIPARALPNGQNFYSPQGLFPFQAEHVAEGYLRTNPGGDQGLVVVWDTGLGKTIYGMALAALLFEDGQIDQAIVVAEKNKIVDWQDDFEAFTTLAAHIYHGPNRQKRLEKTGVPHVLISTYDTLRADLVSYQDVPGRKSKKAFDGPLMDSLGLRGKRTLWIFDEITALKGRGSQRHKAFSYVLTEQRKLTWQRVMGLTATPIERDIEDTYNIGRLVAPGRSLTVANFEKAFTNGRDPYQRYSYKKGASEQFGELFRPLCLIKHKTDPDVIEQFPKQVEKALWLPLEPAHRRFYEAVQEMLFAGEGVPQRLEDLAITVLRMTAGHPASHLYAHNDLSKMIVDVVGRDALLGVPSTKSLELIQRFRPLIKGQGEQAIVFSFFGRSVLRCVGDDLRGAGFTVAEYHGGQNLSQNEHSKKAFIAGDAEILLASDAASQGLNLQNAGYVFEYESARTFARRTQRINRVHRISSDRASVSCYTCIAEGTVEEPIARKMLRRNEDHDNVVGGEAEDGYVSAAERRLLLGFGRKG